MEECSTTNYESLPQQSLGLLINLVESSAKNRMMLMKLMTPPIDKELYGAKNIPEQNSTKDNVPVVEALVQV